MSFNGASGYNTTIQFELVAVDYVENDESMQRRKYRV